MRVLVSVVVGMLCIAAIASCIVAALQDRPLALVGLIPFGAFLALAARALLYPLPEVEDE